MHDVRHTKRVTPAHHFSKESLKTSYEGSIGTMAGCCLLGLKILYWFHCITSSFTIIFISSSSILIQFVFLLRSIHSLCTIAMIQDNLTMILIAFQAHCPYLEKFPFLLRDRGMTNIIFKVYLFCYCLWRDQLFSSTFPKSNHPFAYCSWCLGFKWSTNISFIK